MFTKEMQRALEADGEKLRQLTGDDYKIVFDDEWETCPECGGDGEVLQFRPQHDDPDFCTVRQCFSCGGSGWICK